MKKLDVWRVSTFNIRNQQTKIRKKSLGGAVDIHRPREPPWRLDYMGSWSDDHLGCYFIVIYFLLLFIDVINKHLIENNLSLRNRI